MSEIQLTQQEEQLLSAAREEDVKPVEELVKKGANVNVKDADGHAPLHLAAYNGRTKVVQFLITEGTDVNIENNNGNTPLHWAVNDGCTEVVKALIKGGADVNVKDADGRTPLHLAAQDGYTEVAQALIAKGADVNIKNNNYNTPLYCAAQHGHTEVVQVLIEEGADINIKDKDVDGNTPLHLATQNGHTETVKCFINHIAKLEAAGLYVSPENLELKNKLKDIFHSEYDSNIASSYKESFDKCNEEVKKLEKENKPLYDFLKESDIKKLVSIWEKNESVRSKFDDQESLKEQYPEYAHILINKANDVKKVIFLHNHKPLTDVLSQHYNCDFKTMTFTGIRTLFDVRRNDFREKLGSGGISLINFVEADFVAQKYVPTLKVQAFAKVINTVLDNPNFGQIQGQAASRS